MRVTILGSGTLLPDDRHRSPAHFVAAGELGLLLDCGSGTVHGLARERLSWKGISHVALTHFHTDHVGDLAPLLFAFRHGIRPERREPLSLLGPRGLADHLEALARAHGSYVTQPGFPLDVVELGHGAAWSDPGRGLTLRAHATPHTKASLAYRVETDEGTVGYTGDTGPSEPLGGFFRGVPLLIAECSLADPPAIDSHLSPVSVAALARAAEPGLLVLTHLYPPLRPARLPDLIRDAGYGGPLAVARDGTAIEITAGTARVAEG